MKIQQIARTRKAIPKISVWCAALTAIMLALPMQGFTQNTYNAQQPGASASQTPQAQGSNMQSGQVKEPQALDALKRMASTLSNTKEFTVRTHSTTEVPVPKTGQYVTLIGNSEVAVMRPNKVRVYVRGELPNFDFYFDGKNIAAYAPQNKVYSIMQSPGSIEDMFQVLEQKTGIQIPAADLLDNDPYTALTKGLTSAMVVDKSTVNGAQIEHLAFMSPDVHWQVWIDTSKNFLPQRLAVTYVTAPNFPRRMIEFSNWNLHPNLNASEFVFQKPPNARQIEFQAPSMTPTPTGRQKGQ